MEVVYPPLRAVRVSERMPANPLQDGRPLVISQDSAFALQYDRVLSG
jgi:hypothetical protein